MKVRDLLNYLIEYEKEGFSLDDKIIVRMFMSHGKAGIRGDYIDYKDCSPSYIGNNVLHLVTNENEAIYWQWDEKKESNEKIHNRS
jgi:hypothetical protein